jgi:hypothetical protein
VCRSTDTSWGANDTDILSVTRLKAEDLSIFIVGEPLDDDTDGTIENVFSYYAYYDGDAGEESFDSNATIEFSFERDDDDDIHASWELGGGAPVSPNTVNAVTADVHWSSSKASIVNIQTSTDIGESHIYTNNIPDVSQSIYHPGSGVFAQNNWADFDPVDYDDSLTASIGIGVRVSSTGEHLNVASFEGKIYEILVYKEALDEINRSLLTYYLGYKYSINITT